MTIVEAIETSGPGGAEQVLLHLCRGLRSRGHRVLPLLMKDGWLAETLEAEGFPTTRLPLRSPLDFRYVRQLRRFLLAVRADVFHSHEVSFAVYGRAATLSLGVPQVATAHGKNFPEGWKRQLLGALLLRPGRAFRLAAVSQVLADHLERRFFLGPRTTRIVPNGIELPPAGAPLARLPGEPLRIVAVGNLYPVKNHGLLIRAISELRARGIPAQLDVLGRGAEEAPLRTLVSELGLGEAVRLPGFRPDVPVYLKTAHVFVSSSRFEAMPLSFLEAMGHALPVVASRVGGVPEVVDDGTNGLLFPDDDGTALVTALAALANDEALRLRLGAAAAAKARKQFSVTAMLGRYENLFHTARAEAHQT